MFKNAIETADLAFVASSMQNKVICFAYLANPEIPADLYPASAGFFQLHHVFAGNSPGRTQL